MLAVQRNTERRYREMRTSIRAQIAATSQAVTDADEAFVRIAVGNVKWERRGLLQHLVIRPC
jgi:hypothetical protein